MKSIIIEQTSSEDFLNQIGALIEETIKRLLPMNKENDFNEEFLTTKETAKLLGICSTSVYNYSKDGKLKAHRIGNTTRYIKSEVLNVMKLGL